MQGGVCHRQRTTVNKACQQGDKEAINYIIEETYSTSKAHCWARA